MRLRLESKKDEKVQFDPNPFSLVLIGYKQRIRPSSFEYPIAHLNVAINRVLKQENSDVTRWAGYIYDSKIEDSFENYKFQDFENITYPMDFKHLGNEALIQYYYEVRSFKKRKADIIFVVPKNATNGTLYYGDQKIKDLSF